MNSHDPVPFRRAWIGLVSAVTVLLAGGSSGALAQAQVPIVPRDYYEERRLLQGERITFCVNPQALTYEFDKAVASAVSETLFLEADFYEIDPLASSPPLDYRLGIETPNIFTLLASECDAFAGFKLAEAGYPEWMAFSRPYYEGRFVFATTNPSYRSLSDVPRSERIGTRYTSQGDIDFVVFLQARRESERWDRAPYTNNLVLLQHFLEGAVDTILIWEPALHAGLEGDLDSAGVRIIPTDPFRPSPVRLGFALESRDGFLRASLDDAVAALVQDGRIEELLARHELAGRPGGTE